VPPAVSPPPPVPITVNFSPCSSNGLGVASNVTVPVATVPVTVPVVAGLPTFVNNAAAASCAR